MDPAIVPELKVRNLDISREFYVDTIGFDVRFSRAEERFLYLTRGDAHLMLEEVSASDRVAVGELVAPLGRGVNLQIRWDDFAELIERSEAGDLTRLLPVEERWYRQGDVEVGQRQLWVQDPDGYLLRFVDHLGRRPRHDPTRVTE